MNRLIVSAPFGNYLSFPGVTSTIGTYTLKHRAGLLRRIWRVISTVRYSRRNQAWVNRLGLPNPGITSVTPEMASGKILSIHGFSELEWMSLADTCCQLLPLAVELNLSCPNVTAASMADLGRQVRRAVPFLLSREIPVIVKLPPVRWMDLALPLFEHGCRIFHCCNTIPTPAGGMSGKPLKQFSLWAIHDLRVRFHSNIMIIGGGGVTCEQDARDYLDAGADHVAIGSMLLNPFNWRKVKGILKAASGEAVDLQVTLL
jgi:dihydroorotate dehydrogenase